MAFRSQLEPSIKSYECFMFLENSRFGNHTELMDSWKTLIVFFFQKPRKSKNTPYYQKNLRLICEIDQKVPDFYWKTQKNATSKNDL